MASTKKSFLKDDFFCFLTWAEDEMPYSPSLRLFLRDNGLLPQFSAKKNIFAVVVAVGLLHLVPGCCISSLRDIGSMGVTLTSYFYLFSQLKCSRLNCLIIEKNSKVLDSILPTYSSKELIWSTRESLKDLLWSRPLLLSCDKSKREPSFLLSLILFSPT